MSASKTVQKTNSKQCPKCEFAGDESNKSKFSTELISRFPLGFAQENHARVKTVMVAGFERQEFVKDPKTNEILFNKIRRCPVCGHSEGAKL